MLVRRCGAPTIGDFDDIFNELIMDNDAVDVVQRIIQESSLAQEIKDTVQAKVNQLASEFEKS